MRRAPSACWGLFVACLALTSHAAAQTRLAEVERAYAEVDYERTRSLATAAVRQGKNDRAASGELYLLWAIAAAALDQHDEARRAFAHALAANPELKLERSLSPKIRAPYLEARGAMSGAGGQVPLELTVERRGRDVELGLRDNLNVAVALALWARARPTDEFTQRRFHPAPAHRVPLPAGSELQYFVQVLDAHGNVLFSSGTQEDPRRLVAVTPEAPPSVQPNRPQDRNPLPYYVASGALATLGVAAGSFATAMYLRREDAAREWNGPACEHPGMTRSQQCDAIDDRRQRAEYLSIGFGASAGALLLGGVVTLLLAPAAARPNVTLEAGAQDFMLRWRTRL